MNTKQFRLLVIAAGCLLGGPYLVLRYFSALPSLESLTKFSGNVAFDTETRRTRHTKTEYPVLVLQGTSTRFKYLEWFPHAGEIFSLLRPGEPTTIWSDAGDENWVWRVEQGGKIAVSYSEIRDAVAANRRFDWVFGLITFGIGAFAGFMFLKNRRNSEQTSSL